MCVTHSKTAIACTMSALISHSYFSHLMSAPGLSRLRVELSEWRQRVSFAYNKSNDCSLHWLSDHRDDGLNNALFSLQHYCQHWYGVIWSCQMENPASYIGCPFINARVLVNTCWKWTASACIIFYNKSSFLSIIQFGCKFHPNCII